MSELVVVGFKNDMFRASAVLNEKRAGDEAWTSTLHAAIATYRDDHGKLIVDQSFESTKGNAAIGSGLIGSLVGLALAALALPVTAAIGGAVALGSLVAGAVGGVVVGAHHAIEPSWWKDDIEIPDEFLARVRAMVQQGDSAIFFLLRAPDPDDLAVRFAPMGGTVLRSVLTPEQANKVRTRLSL